MSTLEANLKIEQFNGLRGQNAVADPLQSGQISASEMKNVELLTQNAPPSGICSMKGRKEIAALPDQEIIGQWESVQLGVSYWIVYAVDGTKGYLYHFKPSTQTFDLIDDSLTPVRQANGLTMAQGFDDVFVFTNGVDDYVCVNMTGEVSRLNAVDAEQRPIRGLCLKTQNGRLITNSGNRVHWSRTGDIFDWNTDETDVVTNPAYQEFDRDITALETYGDALVVFTETHSVQFTGNPGDPESFARSGATGGGTASFQSVLKFDNKLFYYDPVAKNIFAYYLYDSGQMRPSDGLGNQVLNLWSQIDPNRLDEVALKGYVSGPYSEIWASLPLQSDDKILIFDYPRGEWVVRDMGPVKALTVYQKEMFAAVGGSIVKERSGDSVLGDFVESSYTCHPIDLGSDSNLKVPKMPLILTFDDSASNNFSLEIMLDNDPKTKRVKRIEKSGDAFLIWATEDGSVGGEWAMDDGTGGYYWNFDDALEQTFNLYGLLPFKQLRLRFFTEKPGDSFAIRRLELKRVKIKTKMLG